MHQVSRTQTTKKPEKRKVSQGTFAQNKTQDKVIAEQKATQEKMLRDIRRESDVAKGKKLIKSTSNHSRKARKLRGRLQEAIITKEILDKPVSLRKIIYKVGPRTSFLGLFAAVSELLHNNAKF